MSLRDVLLAALSKQSDTGYGLNRRLRDDLGHIWHARLQQVYRELGRLQEEGLVEVECVTQRNRPDKKRYSLTQAGTDKLDAWLTRTAPPLDARNESFVRLYCIERVPRDVAERLLDARREQWERECHELRTKLGHAGHAVERGLGYVLTLEAALVLAEAKAAWCGRALERLVAGAAPARSNGASSLNGATPMGPRAVIATALSGAD
jgi:DNA-binding PadR family transcriptional regulator